jgi:nicotinamidase-related amidase
MPEMQRFPELPVPPHFDPAKVGEVWKVPYEERAAEARIWAETHRLQPAAQDRFRIVLLLVDVQITFCIPGFELYVGGRTGTGAVDDNRRLVEFIYRNLGSITQISATFDTHQAAQIFHALFLVNEQGEHPAPYTLVSAEDVRQGRWQFNADLAGSLGIDPEYGLRHLEHYTAELATRKKYDLTIWPYHAMLGGIGHALVPAVEEAIFFHSVLRYSRPDFEIKGYNPLTEHYSAIGPEVLTGPDGEIIGEKSRQFFEKLENFDALIIAGQAKSHCVAWTVEDLLEECQEKNPGLAEKVYLLEDCSSPVVVPGAIDYTDQAEAAYRRFAEAGMQLVRSTEAMANWITKTTRKQGEIHERK